jgi:inosine/xanthosine triphosphate pyrophosphatase family protein
MKATLASKNPHKARELAVLLPGWEIEPIGAAELPEEVGETFYANVIKGLSSTTTIFVLVSHP